MEYTQSELSQAKILQRWFNKRATERIDDQIEYLIQKVHEDNTQHNKDEIYRAIEITKGWYDHYKNNEQC